jgi:hypothetical protein
MDSPSASTYGRPTAKASWSTLRASRTIRLHSPPSAPPANVGTARPSHCARRSKTVVKSMRFFWPRRFSSPRTCGHARARRIEGDAARPTTKATSGRTRKLLDAVIRQVARPLLSVTLAAFMFFSCPSAPKANSGATLGGFMRAWIASLVLILTNPLRRPL